MSYFSRLVILACILIVGLTSCSEKFNVTAPYKNVTVVYGILDRVDTAHYVRILKAFVDENKSSLVMAQQSDSSYYSNLDVRIAKIYMKTGRVQSYIPLTRIDLTTEGYPKQPGSFYTAPNYAYKFKEDLDPGYIYRILITNPATGNVDSGETVIIDDVSRETFYVNSIDDSGRSQRKIDFANQAASATNTFNGRYTAPDDYNYLGRTSPVAIVQGTLKFRWVDSNSATGTREAKSYSMDLNYAPNNEGSFQFEVQNVMLYAAIKRALGQAPANVYRLMDRCELTIYLGTAEFYSYINVQSLQNTGLTGSEIKPNYTNMKGKDVLGLYANRGMRTGYVTLGDATLQLLKTKDELLGARVVGTAY